MFYGIYSGNLMKIFFKIIFKSYKKLKSEAYYVSACTNLCRFLVEKAMASEKWTLSQKQPWARFCMARDEKQDGVRKKM